MLVGYVSEGGGCTCIEVEFDVSVFFSFAGVVVRAAFYSVEG